MIRWAHPQLLALAPAALLFAAGCLWAVARRRKDVETIAADPRIAAVLWDGVSWRRKTFKAAAAGAAVLALALALAGPQWGYHEREVRRRGSDVVVAIDVSKSMLAEDMKPSRLGSVKREVKGLIDSLQGDRVAIVAFAGTAFLQCPLTSDYGTAKLFVDELSAEALPRGGTNIAAAIRTGLEAFEGHEKKSRALVVITDGEDHEGNLEEVLAEAQKDGVAVFPVGVGGKEGAPIPAVDETGATRFLKDDSGRMVITRREDATIQKIAQMTGGRPTVIGSGDILLEELYRDTISKFEKKDLGSSRQRRYEPRFIPFVWAALVLYLASVVVPERRGGRR